MVPIVTLSFGRALSASAASQRRAVALDLVGLLLEQARHLAQHVGEGGPAVFRLLREISAAPERLALRREEHRQRPAALLAEVMQRRHIDLVDVGPLLAVDLDVDEQLVHHRRDARVFEQLVRHHMAPVAGRIADREQDRLVLCFCVVERVRPPLAPVHRIVLVLEQIGRRRLREAVGVAGVGAHFLIALRQTSR